MSYLDKNLVEGETIIFRTKKNKIMFFYPVLVLVFCAYASVYMLSNPVLEKIVWAPWVVGVVFFCSVWLDYVTSEFAITNKRVMMREGFINRHANEIRISTISQVNVDQSLLGQLFGYGTVSLNTFGAFDSYNMIAKPNAFQQNLNAQLDKLVK